MINVLVLLRPLAVDERILPSLRRRKSYCVVLPIGTEGDLIDLRATQVNDLASRNFPAIDNKKLHRRRRAVCCLSDRHNHIPRRCNMQVYSIGTKERFAIEHRFHISSRPGMFDCCIEVLAVCAPLRGASAVRCHLSINHQTPLAIVGGVGNDQCIVIAVWAERNVSQVLFAASHRARASRNILAIENKASMASAFHHGGHSVAEQKYMLAVRCETKLATRTIELSHIGLRAAHEFLAVHHDDHLTALSAAVRVALPIGTEGNLSISRTDLPSDNLVELRTGNAVVIHYGSTPAVFQRRNMHSMRAYKELRPGR